MARVAVIIPCHDDGALVRDAVASVLREPEPAELVVVDDGSAEAATLEVLGGLEREGVRVLHQPNGGPGTARTTGLRATSARLVLPLDADDELAPGALGDLADVLDSHPEAAFTWGDYEIFGDVTGLYRAPTRPLPWTLLYRNIYPVTSMVRRAALETVGGWDARGYEDWSLWLKLLAQDLHGVPAGRVAYRRRIHGTARGPFADRKEHRRLYRELRLRAPEAFARRAHWRRVERPNPLKRVAMPLLFGSRPVGSARLEALVKRALYR